MKELDKLSSKDIQFEHGQIEIVNETPQEQKRYWLRNRLTLSLLSVLFLTIVFWLVAGIYLPKVKLGNQLVAAHRTDSSLQNLIKQQSENYQLTIAYPDGSKKNFSLPDMGMKVD